MMSMWGLGFRVSGIEQSSCCAAGRRLSPRERERGFIGFQGLSKTVSLYP